MGRRRPPLGFAPAAHTRNVPGVAHRLVIVGGGKMGEALLAGLITSGWAKASELAVVEKLPARRDLLTAAYPEVDVTDSPPAADGAVVAVKPGDVEEACRSLAAAGVRRVLSIAAGVRLADLETWLGGSAAVPVVRA